MADVQLLPVWKKNKRSPYWNSSSLCDFDHIAVICVTSCIKLPNFAPIEPSATE